MEFTTDDNIDHDYYRNLFVLVTMLGTGNLTIEPTPDIMSKNISNIPFDRSSDIFQDAIVPFFEDLEIILEKRGYKVFLHDKNDEVYLGILNDAQNGFLIKVSLMQKDDRIVVNYGCLNTASQGWETYEKNITVNEVPDTINTIGIGILGDAIFPKLSNYISHT